MKSPEGAVAIPRLDAMLKFLRIERPTSATRRSSWIAVSITCCTRWMLEANEVTMIRPLQSEKVSSRAGPTLDSDGAVPGRSALVESPQSSSNPSPPNSASLVMSAGAAVDRGLVELVVAGHQDRAVLRGEQHGPHVRDRVRKVDQLETEGPGFGLLPAASSCSGASESLCSSSFERTMPIVSWPP